MKSRAFTLAWSALNIWCRLFEVFGRTPPGELAALEWLSMLEGNDRPVHEMCGLDRDLLKSVLVRTDKRVNARGAEGWQ